MSIIILFQDNPDAPSDIRTTHMGAHLAFLEANKEVIEAAGPLSETDGSAQGGIWVLNTTDATTAEALVKADPFWPTGLRQSYQILHWKQVFADGTHQI